jgi:phosphoglycerate dehydrogenase-like enzyme
MGRPIVLINRAGFYPAGWVEANWPEVSGLVDIAMTSLDDGPDLLSEIARADVLYSRNPFKVGKEILAAGRNLRGVVMASVGFDLVDLEAASEFGIPVANSPGNTTSLAETNILLVLALAKRLPFWVRTARSGVSAPASELSMQVGGKTIGIVGLGRIGKATAALAKALGMEVLAFGPRLRETDLAEVVGLEELLRRSDFVSLNANLNAESHQMIDAEALGLMKPTAFIVNTARGQLIDEAALVAALEAGQIAGAGLDVFEVEPPRADNPLLAMENVIGTPHRLGHSLETRRQCAAISQQNILSFLRGELPEFTINRDFPWRFAGQKFAG